MSRNERRRERETTSAEFEDHTVRDIAILIAGIGIGSGVALLLAPTSGEEVRHAIGRRYHKTVRNIGRSTEDLRDRAEELFEHAHDLRDRVFHHGRGEAARREA